MDTALALIAAAVLGTALTVLFTRRAQLLAPVALLALPFRLPIAYGESTYSLLLPLYLVIAAAVVAHLVAVRRGQARLAFIPRTSLRWTLVTVVGLYLLGATYSSDAEKAVEQFIFFYLPFLLLFSLLTAIEWTATLARTCLFVLVGLALVLVGIGFYEYGTKELLLNPKVISANQFESYFRVNSLFFDPNIYGRFLIVVMLALCSALLWTRRSSGLRTIAAIAVALMVLWGGLVLTFSQSSFVSLLAGLVVLAALRWNVWKTVAITAVTVTAAILVVTVFPQSIRLDYSDTRSIDRSTSGRVELITGGLELFGDRPLYGYGSGSFEREYRSHRKASSERAASASHTIPVTVAAEQGIPGLVAYIVLLIVALITLLPGARGSPLRAAVAAAFIALIVHTQLYAAFLEDPLTWVLLAIGVSTGFASAKQH